MRRLALVPVLVAAILAALPAAAQRHDDRGWHDRDIHRFHEHDMERWRGGRWIHGHHGGRDGWWWVVGPAWYWYPAPVYPFPDPYLPPVVVAPAPPPLAAPLPPPQLYYWCDRPRGWYPYVAACSVPWRGVPAG